MTKIILIKDGWEWKQVGKEFWKPTLLPQQGNVQQKREHTLSNILDIVNNK